MAEDEAGHGQGQHLARRHHDREDDGPELLDGVEDEELARRGPGSEKGASMTLQLVILAMRYVKKRVHSSRFENSTRDDLSSKNESKRVKTDRDTSLER